MYNDMIASNKDRYVTASSGYQNYESDMEKLKDDFLKRTKKYDRDVVSFLH